jgi:hypothetical protein
MADETKQVEETGEVAETTEAQETTPTIEELSSQIAELSKLDETRKNEIAGLNRANTEAATKYQDLLKTTETDKQTKERLDKEKFAQDEADRTARLQEITDSKSELNQLKIQAVAFKNGYTEEDLELLKFNTPEEVENHFKWTQARDLKTKESTLSEIEKNRTGNREILNDTKQTEQLTLLEQKIINRR